MKNEMQGIQEMLGGKLVTGDHDSISLFGAAAQSDLNQISRKITDIVQKRFYNQENMIDEERVRAAIEQFEDSLRAYKSNRWRGFSQKKRQREYDTTLDTIELMSTSLKLRQVELLRETKIFERLIASLKVCEINLTECISTGEMLLQNQPTGKRDAEDIFWYSRLEKRISDLRISRSLAQQFRVEACLLQNSGIIICDQIRNILSNVLPIWRNQASLVIQKEIVSKGFGGGNSTDYQNVHDADESLQYELHRLYRLSEELNDRRKRINQIQNGKEEHP